MDLKPQGDLAVVFDIGNVLLPFDYGRALRALRRAGTKDPDLAAVEEARLTYERGGLPRRDFLDLLRREFGHPGPPEEIERAWEDIFEPNPWVWSLVERLHGHHALYLFSNIGCLHHDYIRRRYPVFRLFRGGVFSYRARSMKPEPEIFHAALQEFGANPGRILYLDDLISNVEAARGHGWQAALYHPSQHAEILLWLRGGGVQCV